jgi:hypothetical protein
MRSCISPIAAHCATRLSRRERFPLPLQFFDPTRLVDRELSPKPVNFDGLGRFPAREQIVHCAHPDERAKATSRP